MKFNLWRSQILKITAYVQSSAATSFYTVSSVEGNHDDNNLQNNKESCGLDFDMMLLNMTTDCLYLDANM